ncbi:MAG: response regulator [Candidatus Dadabacteria bacterium]|nr:MAG: response regulator [Candidatus Dadabacteria bacterium]
MAMKKALIVEDDPISLKLLANIAESAGIAAIKSSDGFRGWEILLDNPDINVLITDIMMPEMDGYRLIHSVRECKDDRISKMPIIIITGVEANDPELKDIMKLEPIFLFTKPVDREGLTVCLNEKV